MLNFRNNFQLLILKRKAKCHLLVPHICCQSIKAPWALWAWESVILFWYSRVTSISRAGVIFLFVSYLGPRMLNTFVVYFSGYWDPLLSGQSSVIYAFDRGTITSRRGSGVATIPGALIVLPGLETWLRHWLALWPRGSYTASLGLSFLETKRRSFEYLCHQVAARVEWISTQSA